MPPEFNKIRELHVSIVYNKILTFFAGFNKTPESHVSDILIRHQNLMYLMS